MYVVPNVAWMDEWMDGWMEWIDYCIVRGQVTGFSGRENFFYSRKKFL